MNSNPYLQNLGYGAPVPQGSFSTPGMQTMPPQGMGGSQMPPAPWHMGGMHGPHNFDPNGVTPMGSFGTGGTQPYNPMGALPSMGPSLGGSNGGSMGGPQGYPPMGNPGMRGNGGLLGGWR